MLQVASTIARSSLHLISNLHGDCRLLTWLSEKGVYKSEDLKIALGVAEMSIDELPCCALLSQYLPGPRHSAYELCHADTAFPMGSGMVATTLQARYQDTCPSLNYWGLAASACRDTMKVLSAYRSPCEKLVIMKCAKGRDLLAVMLT